MAGWKPMEREPDALKGALFDYIRDRTGLVLTRPSAEPTSLGQTTLTVADGRKLAVELMMMPERPADYGGRSAIVFAITGQAAERLTGYRIEGQAIIDNETRCFLFIDIKLAKFEHGQQT